MFQRKSLNITNIFLYVFVLLAIRPQSTHAEDQSKLKPFLSGGIKALYGLNYSDDMTTVMSRQLGVLGVEGILGGVWNGVIVGAGIDYNFWQQLTAPSQVNNSNTQGRQFGLAPVVGYTKSGFTLLGKYYLKSVYTFGELDPSNNSSNSYGAPHLYFAVQLRYQGFYSGCFVGVEYSSGQYREEKINGSTLVLSAGEQSNFKAAGIVFGYTY